MLLQFLHEGSGYINAHTLITGNSDTNFVQEILLPQSIELWLCQNNAMPERKGLLTLPIGIENIKLGRTGLKKYYKKHDADAIINKVLVPPMSPSNEIRAKIIFRAMQKPDLFIVKREIIPENEYFSLTREFKFIFACEGNGFENHRIWETLYQGSFPVLIKTNWSLSLRYLNLPILWVSNIDEINQEMLLNFAELHKNFNPRNTKSLWISYWKELIESGE